MLKLPPGLPYFIRRLGVNVLFPIVALLALARALHTFGLLHAELPTGWVAFAAVLSILAAYAMRIIYSDWSVKRRAAQMGAVLPRRWEGKAFGSVDLLQHGIKMFLCGYPGTFLYTL